MQQSRDRDAADPRPMGLVRPPSAAEELKLAFSVVEFSRVSGVSRSLLYEMPRLGDLRSIKIRGRRLILAEDGLTWLRSHRRPV